MAIPIYIKNKYTLWPHIPLLGSIYSHTDIKNLYFGHTLQIYSWRQSGISKCITDSLGTKTMLYASLASLKVSGTVLGTYQVVTKPH